MRTTRQTCAESATTADHNSRLLCPHSVELVTAAACCVIHYCCFVPAPTHILVVRVRTKPMPAVYYYGAPFVNLLERATSISAMDLLYRAHRAVTQQPAIAITLKLVVWALGVASLLWSIRLARRICCWLWRRCWLCAWPAPASPSDAIIKHDGLPARNNGAPGASQTARCQRIRRRKPVQ